MFRMERQEQEMRCPLCSVPITSYMEQPAVPQMPMSMPPYDMTLHPFSNPFGIPFGFPLPQPGAFLQPPPLPQQQAPTSTTTADGNNHQS